MNEHDYRLDYLYRLTELYKALNHEDQSIDTPLRSDVVKKLRDLVANVPSE